MHTTRAPAMMKIANLLFQVLAHAGGRLGRMSQKKWLTTFGPQKGEQKVKVSGVMAFGMPVAQGPATSCTRACWDMMTVYKEGCRWPCTNHAPWPPGGNGPKTHQSAQPTKGMTFLSETCHTASLEQWKKRTRRPQGTNDWEKRTWGCGVRNLSR